MELTEAYKVIEKYLTDTNNELGFSKVKTEDELKFKGNRGLYRLLYDAETQILSFECAYEDNGDETKFETVSKSLFELGTADERNCRSVSNEIADEVKSLFAARKKVSGRNSPYSEILRLISSFKSGYKTPKRFARESVS